MGKTIGIQRELNEIAEALTVNGFEVTNMFNTNKELDAIIYYNEESDVLNTNELLSSKQRINDNHVLKINAAKTNIDVIMKILQRL